MNYFIFNDDMCIAYTSEKKLMKRFLKQFKNQTKFRVDKVKKISKAYQDSDTLSYYTLYLDNNIDMVTNESFDSELYYYLQDAVESMLNNCQFLEELTNYMWVTADEQYILNQFFLHFGFAIEDIETLYSDYTDIQYIMEYKVLPRVIQEQTII